MNFLTEANAVGQLNRLLAIIRNRIYDFAFAAVLKAV